MINAATSAGVGFVAYTSVLHADSNPVSLAQEHRVTEALIRKSGLAYAFLRHGGYTENFSANAALEVARDKVIGSAGMGRLSTATRADYASGDAAVLMDRSIADQIFELAGDENFTLMDYAAALTQVSGTLVTYVDMPEAEYRTALVSAGLPDRIAGLLSESSARSASDVMFDGGLALSRLMGRPTTPIRATVKNVIAPRHRTTAAE